VWKEGRKGGCTADTRFCVQSASNLIRLFLGTLLTRRSFLILFDCFSLSLSLSLYIYIYDPPLNSFFVCLFVGSPFLLALPFSEETLGCIQVRAKIWCPHILGSVEVQYRNISGMPEQSTWVFTHVFLILACWRFFIIRGVIERAEPLASMQGVTPYSFLWLDFSLSFTNQITSLFVLFCFPKDHFIGLDFFLCRRMILQTKQ
jgi:hypothetical protein